VVSAHAHLKLIEMDGNESTIGQFEVVLRNFKIVRTIRPIGERDPVNEHKLEATIQRQIAAFLQDREWHVERMLATAFQTGIPDLYAYGVKQLPKPACPS
jgi:hypothetical protein